MKRKGRHIYFLVQQVVEEGTKVKNQKIKRLREALFHTPLYNCTHTTTTTSTLTHRIARMGDHQQYKCVALEVLKGKERQDEAKDIITRVAKQVWWCMSVFWIAMTLTLPRN